MTERAPARRRGPRASTVILSSVAAFLAVLAFLTFQLRAGHDPALGKQAVAQVQQQPQRVVVRKVEDDWVITKVIPAQGGSAGSQPALTTGSSSSSSPAVVTSGPAPVVAAPAPAPVTRTS